MGRCARGSLGRLIPAAVHEQPLTNLEHARDGAVLAGRLKARYDSGLGLTARRPARSGGRSVAPTNAAAPTGRAQDAEGKQQTAMSRFHADG
jgi:hypothetical protein